MSHCSSNLIPYGPDHPPPGKGRPPGSKNRSTVLRELYDMMIKGKDLSDTEKEMPVEVAVMTALIKKGLAGDVPAIKEAQDTLYGKIPDKQEHSGPDGGAIENTVRKYEFHSVTPVVAPLSS